MRHPERAKRNQERGEVLRYLTEKNKRNPGYLDELMDSIWQRAPLEDRITILAVQSLLAPQDPEMKEAYAKACLFENYITSGRAHEEMLHDRQALEQLEASLLLESGPPETDPHYPDAA